ncbi:MAG TPA: hypothetical protein VGR25_01750 [bacterium]|nr:hypothetical protein [bacterium]
MNWTAPPSRRSGVFQKGMAKPRRMTMSGAGGAARAVRVDHQEQQAEQ